MTQQTGPRAVTSSRSRSYTRWSVLFVLAVLTVVEFIFAVAVDANVPIIFPIAVAKGAIIAYYFMRIKQIFHPMEDE